MQFAAALRVPSSYQRIRTSPGPQEISRARLQGLIQSRRRPCPTQNVRDPGPKTHRGARRSTDRRSRQSPWFRARWPTTGIASL
jgi:hypothetical protein